jgi:hypothetical protein
MQDWAKRVSDQVHITLQNEAYLKIGAKKIHNIIKNKNHIKSSQFLKYSL